MFPIVVPPFSPVQTKATPHRRWTSQTGKAAEEAATPVRPSFPRRRSVGAVRSTPAPRCTTPAKSNSTRQRSRSSSCSVAPVVAKWPTATRWCRSAAGSPTSTWWTCCSNTPSGTVSLRALLQPILKIKDDLVITNCEELLMKFSKIKTVALLLRIVTFLRMILYISQHYCVETYHYWWCIVWVITSTSTEASCSYSLIWPTTAKLSVF